MHIAEKHYSNDGNKNVLDLVPDRAKYILDVGCGAGSNAKHLITKNKIVDGITLSKSEVKYAEVSCRKTFIHNLETGLPSLGDSRYDAIICSHVLEHLCYPSCLLDDIRQYIKPDGVLIVALPNLLWWKTRLRIFCGSFEYSQGGIMDNTHFRWYTFLSAQRLLKHHGYVIRDAKVFGGLPLSRLRDILPSWTYRWADRLVCSRFPGLFGYEMLYVATVAAEETNNAAG
jgi:2-polyprenyl-3-methyl-5-hydroxy-6-metoxy-1,4-benzoquinol methylase